MATSYSAPHCPHWNSPRKRSFQASPILELCAAGIMLQGLTADFGDRTFEQQGRGDFGYSRFREQRSEPERLTRRTIETYADARDVPETSKPLVAR